MQQAPTRKPLSKFLPAGAGALLMYFFDPETGRRRRAFVFDKIYDTLTDLDDAATRVAKDLNNRTQGVFAALTRSVTDREVPDDVLAERVRSRLGRVVSHPGAIDVVANQGIVTLRGPVLAREHQTALRAVERVPGVKAVHDQLEPHEQPGNIPALQGGRPRTDRPDILENNWAPATRFLVGLGGAALALRGLKGRGASPLLAIAGAALLARATTNMELKRLLGVSGRRGIDFNKSIYIDAPIEEVFGFWNNFENFPKFMHNVRSIHRNKDGSWHWEVAGPLGARVQWNSYVTESVPNKILAWATTPDSAVQHAGVVRFRPERTGTRIDIRLTYNPVAGALGHVVASLFGADPLSEMNEDLMRLKTYFETGKPPHDAAQPVSGTQVRDEGSATH